MSEKFTIEDFFVKIIPGGAILGTVFFLNPDLLENAVIEGLDFFYTFMFLIFSLLMGEVLQTIAHEFEWIINIFFKFYKPSEVFLYKQNPVVKSERLREKILNQLSLTKEPASVFDNSYKKLPVLFNRKSQTISQSYFWEIYTMVNHEDEIKAFNRNYLLIRGITFGMLIISTLYLINHEYSQLAVSIVLFLLFLWRARGMARMLVFKSVMIYLKKGDT